MSTSGEAAGVAAGAATAADGLTRAALRRVLAPLPVATVLVELGSGDITFANGRAREIIGGELGSAGADARHGVRVTDAEGREVAEADFPSMRLARGEVFEDLRLDLHRADGTRHLVFSSTLVEVEDGQAGIAVVEDVTGVRTAEAELLEAERAARARAEAAGRRARFLARASDELNRSLDFDTTLQAVASFAVPERADWCSIDVLDAHGGLRRVAIAHTDPEKERLGWELTRRYPPSADEGAAAVVLSTLQPVMQAEVTPEELEAAAQDPEHLALLRALQLSGAIAVPLVVRGRALGVLTFVFEAGRRPDELDLELAQELGRRAAAAIANARLYQDRSHIAQVLQRSLLPPRLPEVPGFTVASRYRAAGEGHEVGGDFYDVFQRGEDAWVLVMGDVCGKGPEAASLTALARWTVRAAALRAGDPARVLCGLNDAILHERGDDDADPRFMTAVCACLAVAEAEPTLLLASAGHPPALLVRPGGEVVPLPGTGPLLGVLEDPVLIEQRRGLRPGEAVVLYTDGLSEAGAPAAPLGTEGLAGALVPVAGRSAEALADAAVDAALARSDGRPRDDVAVLVLRRDDA